MRLKKSIIEVGHLEMSGGYAHKDLPRSTWDGCCKLPIGNSYMLEEIGERFREASTETFSKLSVFSIHTYGGCLKRVSFKVHCFYNLLF